MEPVRILHIVSSMNRAGIENALMNYYRNIDRSRVQFDFLLAKPYKCDFDDEILALGGRIYRIPISNPMKYLLGLNKFFKTHKEYKTIHVHHLPWGAMPLRIAKHHGITNLISHVHFSNDPGKFARLQKRMNSLLRKHSTHYFACSRYAGEKFFGKKIASRNNFMVLNNSIEASKFAFDAGIREKMRKELGLGNNDFVIGQVASFSPNKNQEFTIDVLKNLKSMVPEAHCIFVGTGAIKNEIEDLAREKGVYDSCIFTGSVSNAYDYMQAMDVLVFPSHSEGLGMVAIEAQASGLPAIVSTGVPEECRLTELVTFMPLDAGAEAWAKEIASKRNYVRKARLEAVRDAGYDVAVTANMLEDFYLALQR